MLGEFFRKEITEVFTPRKADVNESMYVARGDLEAALKQRLLGSQHIVIHGESGCGKSWLYKKVLADEDVFWIPANFANASRFRSISKELDNVTTRANPTSQSEISIAGKGGANLFALSGEVSAQTKYNVKDLDPLESCFASARQQAGDKPCYIVFDNLESIFSSKDLMDELGDVITLLDDSNYSRYRVKLIIVGTPSEVREYFEKTTNRRTVANRLVEIPEVGALKKDQAKEFVKKGFSAELKVKFASGLLQEFQEHIFWVTDGIPQFLHEFCLELANLISEYSWLPQPLHLSTANRKWLKSGLLSNYATIEGLMNERDTKAGRKNQVLYALGRVEQETFRTSQIEEIVRKEFPRSTGGVTLDIAGILSRIAKQAESPIKRTPKGDQYRFTAPKFKLCIRAMLEKRNERVDKVDFSDL
jgi:SpoVK/Ycf46/Vps4 family AAA+-type ATPase